MDSHWGRLLDASWRNSKSDDGCGRSIVAQIETICLLGQSWKFLQCGRRGSSRWLEALPTHSCARAGAWPVVVFAGARRFRWESVNACSPSVRPERRSNAAVESLVRRPLGGAEVAGCGCRLHGCVGRVPVLVGALADG